MSANAGHVFVSHSSDNRELANELTAFLEGRGLRIWIAPRNVRPGMDYSEELQLAIENCAAFVVLVTEMANKSPYVRAETEMAFSTQKPIFPVRTTDIQPAPGLAFFLKIRHWTDAYGTLRADNMERLVLELQTLSGAGSGDGSAAKAAPAPPPPSPPPAPGAPIAGAVPAGPPPAPLPTGPEDEDKWRAAIGPNADFYLARWRAMEAKNSIFNWNWPACLVNLFWFAYRKMWLPMGGMIAAALVLGLIGSASPAMGRVTWLLSIGLSFVTGTFGNHLYRRQTAKLVAETSAPGRQEQIDALRSRGGVSTTALVISLVVAGLLSLLIVVGTIAAMRQQQSQLNALAPVDPANAQSDPANPYDPSQTGIEGQSGDAQQGDKPVSTDPPPEPETQSDYYQDGY